MMGGDIDWTHAVIGCLLRVHGMGLIDMSNYYGVPIDTLLTG